MFLSAVRNGASLRSLPGILAPRSLRPAGWQFPSAMAFHGSSFSSVDSTVVSRCTSKLQEALQPVKIHVTSSNDDPNGSHVNILCVSEVFAGKSLVQRQRLVMKAIWEELQGPVHAVDSIVAKTPAEAGMQ